MLTEEQFDKLITNITRAQEEHDLLVKMQSSMDTYQRLTLDALKNQSKEIGKAETAALAAHKRIDTVIVIGGITVFLTIAGLFITVLMAFFKGGIA